MDKYEKRYFIIKILLLIILIGIIAYGFIGPDIGETFEVGCCLP